MSLVTLWECDLRRCLLLTGDIGGSRVEVFVADTEVGISQEHKRRLFAPLFTTMARGTGLELAVSKKTV
jgi:signal transduction histidine kinase